MTIKSLHSFSLVGGTALALRYGHRNSIDLDLFFHQKFDQIQIESELTDKFGDDLFIESGHRNLGLFCYIRKIKTYIVYFPHLPIAEIITEDNIRMYRDDDIAAMKIQAILGRAKKKDFWDLFELLKHYPLEQIIDWHQKKYPSQMLAISIPNAITYFTDAEDSDEPRSFKNQTWEGVKRGIQKAVRDYLI